ncbi:MAG: outer membrane beta-barrel protein [Deltaproteobacteria bacterium]
MQKFLSACVVTCLFASPVVAQSAKPAIGQDWSGLYAGLSAATAHGDYKDIPYPYEYPVSGAAAGLFAGYNYQVGNMVYGGELSYATSTIRPDKYTDGDFKELIDLKARVGYVVGRTMLFGSIGYTSEYMKFDGSPRLNGEGRSFGLGADVKINDQMFVGAEIQRRDLRNGPTSFTTGFDTVVDSLSVRVGMRF